MAQTIVVEGVIGVQTIVVILFSLICDVSTK